MKIAAVKVIFPLEDRTEILKMMDECLASGHITNGANVSKFEAAFAQEVGVDHAIATCSGGAALELGMNLLDVKGKEVIVPTNTYAATAFAVQRAEGSVHLADVDASTFGLSLATVKASVTPDTAGVVDIGQKARQPAKCTPVS